jgi:predicted glutamine amidotransferase
MCRLLSVVSHASIDIDHHLDAFTRLCRTSREYQGHGWGCAILRGKSWMRYRTMTPIWEDSFRLAGETQVLLAHARSAFRDEDIAVENNMPFVSSDQAFMFNGELNGVRLSVEGRTGARKIFRLLQNLKDAGSTDTVGQAMTVIRRRTARIRACNFILADSQSICVHTLFTTDPEYYTMYRFQTARELVISSAPYENGEGVWEALRNGSIEVHPCSF